ncbi:MAG: hypothetical protein PF508_09515 [Spirochaeta sp.]|jgi:hypothetical protein|nr:hypothetical protein [Spirochaeta sp.]
MEENMGERTVVTLKPDGKGRITLGKLLDGVSSVRVSVEEDGRIILEPFQEIPQREAWLYENREALNNVRTGLRQVAEGHTSYLGSFAAFEEDAEESD